MAEAGDRFKLWCKRGAIVAFLPHAVWRERDGESEMLDTFLHAARASKPSYFGLDPNHSAYMLLSMASPRAIVLVSCHIPWLCFSGGGDCVELWAAATSVVPPTEDLTWSVVDVLLQIASNTVLSPYIPTDVWSWMIKQPSLPPPCYRHSIGTSIETVQGLQDIEVLKSYFCVIWSEWNHFKMDEDPKVLGNMCAILHKGFSGSGMGHYRADLIQRLDYILGELDRGLDHFQQYSPYLNANHIQKRKQQYGKLKNVLLEMNVKAITRMSDPMALLLYELTHMDVRRILCNIYVCTPSPMSIASYLPPTSPLYIHTGPHTHAWLSHIHLVTPPPFSPHQHSIPCSPVLLQWAVFKSKLYYVLSFLPPCIFDILTHPPTIDGICTLDYVCIPSLYAIELDIAQGGFSGLYPLLS